MTQWESDVLENLKEIRRHLQRPQEPGVTVIGPHPFKRSIRCEVCGQNQTNCIHTPPEGMGDKAAGGPFMNAKAPLSHKFSGSILDSCVAVVGGKICGMWYGHQVHQVNWDQPHVFSFRGDGTPHCRHCHHPEKHAIHGYTGE